MFPVGPRLIAHLVLNSIVFVMLGSTWTSQYAPKGTLQCSFASSLFLDNISLGLHFYEMPDFTGNEFIHITQKFMSSIIISFGNILYGRTLMVLLTLSFTTRIFLLISHTCSHAAVVFRITFKSLSLSFSHSMSMSVICTTNPAFP
jgi:hypothetical protein